MRRAVLFSAMAILAAWGLASSAQALPIEDIPLSDCTSEQDPKCEEGTGDPPYASELAALLTFDTSTPGELTLTVENKTDDTGEGEFEINEIYFNATSNVSSLTLTSPAGWSLSTSQGADGFGTFDFKLSGDFIEAGLSLDFVFDLSGSGIDGLNFVTEFSTIPPGDTPALVAAHFMRGPNGDSSAFGATIPEPATVLLLGLGLLGLASAPMGRR